MAKVDDVSWHTGADDFPEDVPEENGATHIGMFLTWAIDKGLFVDPAIPPEVVQSVRKRAMSGRDLLLNSYDGRLLSEILDDEGAAFAAKHYDGFLKDFQRLLCCGLRSGYVVEYNDVNCRTMAAALDERWVLYQQEKRKRLH
jgi:hypothetical protein